MYCLFVTGFHLKKLLSLDYLWFEYWRAVLRETLPAVAESAGARELDCCSLDLQAC